MKFPPVVLAMVLIASFVPAVGSAKPAAAAELDGLFERSGSTTASRSVVRTLDPALLAPATTQAPTPTTAAPVVTTTAAPVTTAAPATTAAPVRAARALRPKAPTTTAAPAAESADAPSTGGRQNVVSIARAQVGKAYVSGAKGPNAFDCSGLVFYVFNQAGISRPYATSYALQNQGTRISRSQLQPGDLVIAAGGGHVGIFVGNGQMVHASTPKGGVKLAPIDAVGTPNAYVRL